MICPAQDHPAVVFQNLIGPFTSSLVTGASTPIPTLPPVRTVIALALREVPDHIPISNILVDSHILYIPKTIEPVQEAIVPMPIATEDSPLATVKSPMAVELSPIAIVPRPIAVELAQLAVV